MTASRRRRLARTGAHPPRRAACGSQPPSPRSTDAFISAGSWCRPGSTARRQETRTGMLSRPTCDGCTGSPQRCRSAQAPPRPASCLPQTAAATWTCPLCRQMRLPIAAVPGHAWTAVRRPSCTATPAPPTSASALTDPGCSTGTRRGSTTPTWILPSCPADSFRVRDSHCPAGQPPPGKPPTAGPFSLPTPSTSYSCCDRTGTASTDPQLPTH